MLQHVVMYTDDDFHTALYRWLSEDTNRLVLYDTHKPPAHVHSQIYTPNKIDWGNKKAAHNEYLLMCFWRDRILNMPEAKLYIIDPLAAKQLEDEEGLDYVIFRQEASSIIANTPLHSTNTIPPSTTAATTTGFVWKLKLKYDPNLVAKIKLVHSRERTWLPDPIKEWQLTGEGMRQFNKLVTPLEMSKITITPITTTS